MRSIAIVAVVLFIEVCIVVEAQRVTCGGTGAFNGFVGVFERQSGKLTGFSPQCSEGTLNVGEQKDVPNHFPYNTQWFGQEWSIKSNEQYELRQANCPPGEVLKGFAEWRNGDDSCMMGLRVVCSLSSAEFDYIIDLYQEQGKHIAQNNNPQPQNICQDMIHTIHVNHHAQTLHLAQNIQCETGDTMGLASETSLSEEPLNVSPVSNQQDEFKEALKVYTPMQLASVIAVSPSPLPMYIPSPSPTPVQKQLSPNKLVETGDNMEHTPQTEDMDAVISSKQSNNKSMNSEESPKTGRSPKPKRNRKQRIQSSPSLVESQVENSSPTPSEWRTSSSSNEKIQSSPPAVESQVQDSSPILNTQAYQNNSLSSNVHPQYAMLQQRKSPLFQQYQVTEPQSTPPSEGYQEYDSPSIAASTLNQGTYTSPEALQVAAPLPTPPIQHVIDGNQQLEPTPAPSPVITQLLQQPNIPVTSQK